MHSALTDTVMKLFHVLCLNVPKVLKHNTYNYCIIESWRISVFHKYRYVTNQCCTLHFLPTHNGYNYIWCIRVPDTGSINPHGFLASFAIWQYIMPIDLLKMYMHVGSNYILQPPKYLIIFVTRLRYIKNTITKYRGSIPNDMTKVLGLHKFNLHATIDNHGQSMYFGPYISHHPPHPPPPPLPPPKKKKKKKCLQRDQNYGSWNEWYQKHSSTAHVVMYKMIM